LSDTLLTYVTYAVTLVIVAVPLIIYLRRMQMKQARARDAAENGNLFSEGPRAQHPHIDVSKCIGCGSCVRACPEGDVLGVIGGKASIIKGYKCIGHALCAEACPVEAIKMVASSPSMSADLPFLSGEHETNIPNLFIAGELGGLALIKNAVNEGRDCVDIIKRRVEARTEKNIDPEVYDVCIVGAGPAGISASLRAIEKELSYITLEQNEIGGTVSKYPRQKLVMTSPVEFPLYGKFKKISLSKEELIEFWNDVGRRGDFRVRTGEAVESINKTPDGNFLIETRKQHYRARAVILALGRRGLPKKLGIKGEELPKVMYSLIEAEAYSHKDILVVGGGDSAVEAAMGLANQKGNRVTLSYRKGSFTRLKERNARRIEEYIRSNRLNVLYNSNPVEIRKRDVIIDVDGNTRDLPNDYVWIFAGGASPNAFLEKIGIQFGMQSLASNTELTADHRV
jgi:thioredoxin reductase (NADPH)